MGNSVKKYLSGQDVCTLLNKSCAGPIGYYLIPNKKDKVGMVIHKQFPDVSVGGGQFNEAFGDEGQELAKKEYPAEVFNILPSIRYTFVGKDLTIKLNADLPIEETMIGKTYEIAKIPYARGFLYLIKDFDKEHLNDLLLGLAFSIYIEGRRSPEEVEEGAEDSSTPGYGSSFGSSW